MSIVQRTLLASFVCVGMLGLTTGPTLAASPFVGPYVAGTIGHSQLSTSVDADAFSASDVSASGLTGVLHAGISSRVDMARAIVLGIEGDYGFSGGVTHVAYEDAVFDIEQGRTVGVSGRVGVAPGEQLHLFGKLGYAHTRLDGIDSVGKVGVDAFRFGGGGEFALSSNMVMRAEILRANYDSFAVDGVRFEPGQTRITAGFGVYF